MKGKKFILTPEHFDIFKSAGELFVRLFGLTDWHIYYEKEACKLNDAAAEVHIDFSGRMAQIRLAPHWGNEYPATYLNEGHLRRELCRIAFHEVVHVLTADMDWTGPGPRFSTDQVKILYEMNEHAFIRRMENVVFPLFYEKYLEVPDDSGGES